jgi:hypothetical protein
VTKAKSVVWAGRVSRVAKIIHTYKNFCLGTSKEENVGRLKHRTEFIFKRFYRNRLREF